MPFPGGPAGPLAEAELGAPAMCGEEGSGRDTWQVPGQQKRRGSWLAVTCPPGDVGLGLGTFLVVPAGGGDGAAGIQRGVCGGAGGAQQRRCSTSRQGRPAPHHRGWGPNVRRARPCCISLRLFGTFYMSGIIQWVSFVSGFFHWPYFFWIEHNGITLVAGVQPNDSMFLYIGK